jgi:hypothetical protein
MGIVHFCNFEPVQVFFHRESFDSICVQVGEEQSLVDFVHKGVGWIPPHKATHIQIDLLYFSIPSQISYIKHTSIHLHPVVFDHRRWWGRFYLTKEEGIRPVGQHPRFAGVYITVDRLTPSQYSPPRSLDLCQ